MTSLFATYGHEYAVPDAPRLDRMQPATYVVIDRVVLPGSQDLLDALEVLVRLGELIRSTHPGAGDYPLEGTWDVPNASEPSSFEEGITGRIMMRQPDSVELVEFERHRDRLRRTADQGGRVPIEAARLVTVDEGLCIQMLHTGPYGDEPASFDVIARYLEQHALRRKSDSEHREIYLVDARTAEPEAYQTILRVQVEPIPGPGRKK